jgi:hypothetical protein
MPPKPKVKIYYSEEQKRKDLQKKKPVVNGNGKKPLTTLVKKPNNAGKPKKEIKVIKSARRPIQKVSTNPQPKKKPVQLKSDAKQSKSAVAFQTAKVIAQNKSHPRQKEVAELLKTLERGWIDRAKFDELLKKIII